MSSAPKDEERIRIAAEARRKFDSARELVGRKQFREALECYLFAFDNGELVDGWGGVRLSYIPGEIAELGKYYPLALVELRTRRDLREKKILDGETEFSIIHEWTSLNRYLKDSERELEIIKKLETEGRLDEDLKSFVMKSHVDELFKGEDEEAINEYINSEGQSLYRRLYQYELDLLFPADSDDLNRSKKYLEWDRRTVEEEGTKVYGMLIVAQRHNDADEVERVLLSVLPTKEMFAGLIFSAGAAGSAQRVGRLWELAHETLAKDAIEWTEKRISGFYSRGS